MLDHLTGRSCQVAAATALSSPPAAAGAIPRSISNIACRKRSRPNAPAGAPATSSATSTNPRRQQFLRRRQLVLRIRRHLWRQCRPYPRRRAGHLPERISGTPAHSARKHPQGNAGLSQRHHRRDHDHGVFQRSLRQPADSRQSQPLHIAKVRSVDRRHIGAHGAGDRRLHGAAGRKLRAMAAWSERAGEAMVLVYYESIAYSF